MKKYDKEETRKFLLLYNDMMIIKAYSVNFAKCFLFYFVFLTAFVFSYRTIGTDQLVDEMVISMVHDSNVDWLVPGVAPTNLPFEFPLVVIVAYDVTDPNAIKIKHEHIYWDQATILVQLGLLDSSKYDVTGAEQARKAANAHSEPSILCYIPIMIPMIPMIPMNQLNRIFQKRFRFRSR